MNVGEMLDEIKSKIKNDPGLRGEFLETRNQKFPVSAFCEKCRQMGYELYEMDLIEAGEEFYAAIKRSTNGGGENSPVLEGEDDFYEMFFADLQKFENELQFTGRGKPGENRRQACL